MNKFFFILILFPVISYSQPKINGVSFVASKVDEVPIFKEIQITAVNVYSNYGITNKFEAVFSVPYIKSEGKGEAAFLTALGYENVRKGFQDATFFLKYKAYSHRMMEGNFDFIVAAGVQTSQFQ